MTCLATEETHKEWLDRGGFSRMFRLKAYQSAEAAALDAAEHEYFHRYSDEILSDQRWFLGAQMVSCKTSDGNRHLNLVLMSVTEEGPGSSCDSHSSFKTPWSFVIYERSPGSFVSLADINPERTWDEWDSRLNPRRQGESLVKAEFKLLDVDGDGFVDKGELFGVLKHVDAKVWTRERVDRLLRVVDSNEDGRMQYQEMLSWLDKVSHGSSVRTTFLDAADSWTL